MLQDKELKALKESLSTPKKITIVSHRNPDGDAIGSSLGLLHFLNKLNHKVHFISPNEYPDFLAWMPDVDKTIIFEKDTEFATTILKESDFISVHVPAQKNYIFSKKEFSLMKDGAAIVNAARGGVIDEVALIEALQSNKLSFAAIDTFENEPSPAIQILMDGKLSLTPHIGAATNEAQDRIGTELSEQIKSILKP